ncbi:MAG: hypothetical protein JXR77_10215, partial [Lentisphaeria bacterium]|nr:hypothetical protein [Lentisphaeria bacterium]
MKRLLAACLCLGCWVRAGELPDVALTNGQWVCSEGTSLADGVATLEGDGKGYPRVALALPGAALAGKSVRFSAEVTTQGLQKGQDLVYASPKLKIIDTANKKVMSVNNFGIAERSGWTAVDVEVTVPAGRTDPVELELG